ncbi:MAG TPA: glycosyltransferase [Spirochaetota bacterium]|nr:glycosyltransferase [Spirochaetota bacterium]HPC41556.1 glycosyltransferase [Spirochaetota bacterium]HPL16954.1 glycosyltransferase [Spirochaetota bacterium]HQF09075.1 glycosyltransferase [Spirochaetota bacterium]HQH97700.1 glycosyltransferase [Spirochaetota bacterium]
MRGTGKKASKKTGGPRCLVVIPARNEQDTIREVVTRALRHADVSVTDDGSTDATPKILAGILAESKRGAYPHRLFIITHVKSTHIPLGIQDGLKFGVENGYDFIVTMDAGLSHDPDALPGFIGADRAVDVVIGSRSKTENVPLYRRAISRMGALVVNYAISPSYFTIRRPFIRDCTSGYRRYSHRAARTIAEAALRSKSFDFHMEALSLCARAGMSIAETPIHYVFSSSSFNSRVLRQAIRFALGLIATKHEGRTG